MTEQDFKVNANGFTALNAHDGYRKDNTLWFAECSECGDHISNSRHDNFWAHTVYTFKKFYSQENFERGVYNQASSYQVDYCPKVEGKVVECVVEVLA
jgi:hypothetical protein